MLIFHFFHYICTVVDYHTHDCFVSVHMLIRAINDLRTITMVRNFIYLFKVETYDPVLVHTTHRILEES